MWWKVKIEEPDLGEGFLFMDRDNGPVAMFTADGTPVLKGVKSYTTLEVDQPAPDWWQQETPPAEAKFWG